VFTSPPRCLGLVLLLAGLVLPALAQPPEDAALFQGNTPGEKKTAQPPTSPAGKVDPLKLPTDAILVLCEGAGEVAKLVPRAVLLPPEKYQELLDRIARLEAQLRPEKPAAPSICLVKGRVEGRVVVLQVLFEFATDRPNAVVGLACLPARPTGVSLDGQTPSFRADPDGFSVVVEKPGKHQLTLELQTELLIQANGRSFELALPRAPVTRLEMDLPPGAQDVRVAGKTPQENPLLEFKGSRLTSDGLGPLDRLQVSWKADSVTPAGPPVLTAEGRIQVRVDSAKVMTEAELTLKVKGDGQARLWRLFVPPGTTLRIAPADEARVQSVEQVDLGHGLLRTIRLKEPSGEPLTVTLSVHTPLPRAGAVVPVGPFVVLGALRQSGSVLVQSAEEGLRTLVQTHGDLVARTVTEEERRRDALAAFQYWLAGPIERPPPAGANTFLEIETEPVRGRVTTRCSHQVFLVGQAGDSRLWHVRTVIECTPGQTGVDHLEVLLPYGCRYDEHGLQTVPEGLVRDTETDFSGRLSPPYLAAGAAGLRWSPLGAGPYLAASAVVAGRCERLVRFKLAGKQLSPFKITLEGIYAGRRKEEVGDRFLLPRPLDTNEKGGEVTVEVPDDLELLPAEPPPYPVEVTAQEPRRQTWRSGRPLEYVEAACRPYRAEVRATAVIDVTLTPRAGQVRHELHFLFPQTAPASLILRVPEVVAKSLTVTDGGSLAPEAPTPRTRRINLRPAAGKERTLVLDYSFALPDVGVRTAEGFDLPLVQPEAGVLGETRVRVWSDPGSLPRLAARGDGGSWSEQNIEEVKDVRRLPVLVLKAPRLDLPLSLRLADAGTGPAITVLAERALVRVSVTEGGGQVYRASFRISQLATRYLDVELPAPLPTLNLRVTLDGRQVDPETRDDNGQRSDGGRVARLYLGPDLFRKPAVLEVAYQVPAGRAGATTLQSTLHPPVLRGDSGRVPTRWLIALPPGWVAVAPECGPGVERTWVRRGLLLAPRLAAPPVELEHWFAGTDSSPAAHEDADSASRDSGPAPSLVLWRGGLEPLTVTHVPERPWLWGCSLALLLLGLGLYLTARPGTERSFTAGFWVVVVLLLAGAVLVTLVWPTALAAVLFGCEPGVAALLFVGLVRWLLHERYRRQVVFLPSFSRTRAGSSANRTDSARPAPVGEPSPEPGARPWPPSGEPSTVDVPRPNGSRPGDSKKTDSKKAEGGKSDPGTGSKSARPT
jgi:hypothetical protein